MINLNIKKRISMNYREHLYTRFLDFFLKWNIFPPVLDYCTVEKLDKNLMFNLEGCVIFLFKNLKNMNNILI